MATPVYSSATQGSYFYDPVTGQKTYGSPSSANQSAAGSAVRGMFNQANAAIGASTGAAQTGLSAAQGAAATNAGVVSQINADADTLRQNAAATRQDAVTQRGYAGALADLAATERGQAEDWQKTGSAFLNLDETAGGIAGAWAKNYNALSPDSLVSFAASDAQKSIDNSRAQMARVLTRSGVSPSSPAFAAALANAKKYEQALLSGVKSRARLLGLESQQSALEKGMQMAIGATGVSQQYLAQTAQALGGASSATGAATAAEVAAAGQVAQSAGLRATGAGITQAAANTVVGAANSLAQAQQTAADYYSTQSSSILGLLQSGNSKALSALFPA